MGGGRVLVLVPTAWWVASIVVSGQTTVTRSFDVLSSFEVEREVVTGLPYSARAVTQIQPIGGGAVRTAETRVYRDSAGRTRRGVRMVAIGAWAPADITAERVLINDPVADSAFVLDPTRRRARRLPTVRPTESPGAQLLELLRPTVGGRGGLSTTQQADTARTESLGRRVIEGLDAEGTRRTTTVQLGGLLGTGPIEIVADRWMTPALRIAIEIVQRNPLVGTITFRLLDISRDEPDPSLFGIPPGYTLESPMGREPPDDPASPEIEFR
jgi:hypothetical protein